MAAYQQWRINFTANNGGTNLRVVEFQFRETAGVSQTFSGGTASAGEEASATYSAAKAADNDTATEWRSVGDDSWWAYDYGAGVTKDIVEVTIRIPASGETYAPRDFTLEYNTGGSTWVAAATATLVEGWTSGQTKTFTLPFSPDVVLSQAPVEFIRNKTDPSVVLSQAPTEVMRNITNLIAFLSHAPVEINRNKTDPTLIMAQAVVEIIRQNVPITSTVQPFIWIMA
jgi:hypothetical protein